MHHRPTARVGGLMRRRFIQLRPGDTLLEAERLMRMARVRLLPVVEDGLLEGVLSHRRVLESSLAADGAGPSAGSSARWMREMSVDSLMDRRPHVVTPDTPLRVAVERMVEGSEGCLPVVAEGGDLRRLVGILTENDLLRAAYESAPRL
jgi:CBS domain-containing protein